MNTKIITDSIEMAEHDYEIFLTNLMSPNSQFMLNYLDILFLQQEAIQLNWEKN